MRLHIGSRRGRFHRPAINSCLFALILISGEASFAFDFQPSVEGSIVYTDNLNLAPEGQEVDDFVFRIMPRIVMTENIGRVDFQLDYAYSYLRYADATEDSTSFQEGTAKLDLELLENTFFLDSVAVLEQQITNPEGVIFFSNVPIIDNRTDALRLETTPNFRQEIFGSTLDVRYTVGRVDYDSPDIQNVRYQTSDTNLLGPVKNKGISWGLTHRYYRYEYDFPPVSRYQQAFVRLNYDFMATDDFEVYGEFGAESDVLNVSSDTLEEPTWEIGMRQRTANTRWEIGYGDRSYGSVLRALIERRTERSIFGLKYNETPRVQELLFQDRNANDELGVPSPPPTIDRPGTNQRFIWKRFESSYTREATTDDRLILLGFWESRDNIPTTGLDPDAPDLSALNADIQYGATFTWDKRFGFRTSALLEAGWIDREFADGNDDTITRLYLEGRYDLGQKTRLKGWLARTRQQGSDREQDNYTEYQTGITLIRDLP